MLEVPDVVVEVSVIVEGLSAEHVSPGGIVSVRVTVPVNPSRLLTVIVQVPVDPALKFRGFGRPETPKSQAT
jgi:hypothetical protein